MHHWMSFFDWMWMGFAMIAWIAVIALLGYAAVLVAWRHGSKSHA